MICNQNILLPFILGDFLFVLLKAKALRLRKRRTLSELSFSDFLQDGAFPPPGVLLEMGGRGEDSECLAVCPWAGCSTQLVPISGGAAVSQEKQAENGDFGSFENSRKGESADCPNFFLITVCFLLPYIEEKGDN